MKCAYAKHGCLNDAVPNFRMCARCEEFTRGSGPWKLLRVGPQWSAEPPTEPGYYWVWQDLGAGVRLTVAIRRERDGEMISIKGAAYVPIANAEATHWMRIEIPEPPK